MSRVVPMVTLMDTLWTTYSGLSVAVDPGHPYCRPLGRAQEGQGSTTDVADMEVHIWPSVDSGLAVIHLMMPITMVAMVGSMGSGS